MAELTEVLAGFGRELLPWGLTYLLHSTLALGGVALLVRWAAPPAAWEDVLWKAALVGTLATATLKAGSDLGPRVGEISLPAEAPAPAVETTTGRKPHDTGEQATEDGLGATPAADRSRARGVSGRVAVSSGRPSGGGWSAWLALLPALWAVVAAGLFGRLVWRHVRFFRAVADRKPVEDPELRATARQLARRAGLDRNVRLTVSGRLSAPAVLGRREVCLPRRFVTELAAAGRRAALAHELGHLRRRDPWWGLAAGLAASVFFFQPLNWLAVRRLRSSAECLADDWALRMGLSGPDLARCLSEIASWSVPSPQSRAAATAAVVEDGSDLVARTRRLLEEGSSEVPPSRGLRLAAAAGLVSVLLVAGPEVGWQPRPGAAALEGASADVSGVVPPPDRRADVRAGMEASPPSVSALRPGDVRPTAAGDEAGRLERRFRDASVEPHIAEAARELAERRPEQAVPVFLETIKRRPGTPARTVAIRRLRAMPDSTVLPALDETARSHPDAEVQEEAAEWAEAKRARGAGRRDSAGR